MNKKRVWLEISIEVDGEGDDDALMDIIHDELVEYGFTVDDMGMVNPSDMSKFYPTEQETK